MNRLAFVLTVINLVLLIVVLGQIRVIATQSTSQIVRVRLFQLVDENGQVRAQFNVDKITGEVVFRMMDQDGAIRVKMGATKEGSGLLLANHLTQPGVHILADQNGSTITLIEESGAKQIIEP